ncbi:hypothetical protein DOK67_0000939 [Enterococcus sp. DIV0212c]|uniref:hypothetical protein n=1 Tax=Enterococcus sp. DIV0212c TaxID=2230867 RepID=UPI001A9A8713|nr:hypothetical protein [Enterococcus sp. DIV0212c]MBO1352638.1 hypothetical protein [Enterococcus sp. DIV0212c]
MNYQERIAALESFKTTVSNGTIEDSAASFTTEIPGWVGGETAKNGYDNYVNKVKADTAKIVTKQSSFISKIDSRISSIQTQFDLEYARYSSQMNSIYDKDVKKKKEKKQNYYNSLQIDSSVKAKIGQNCL